MALILPSHILWANYLIDDKTSLVQNSENSFDNNKFIGFIDLEKFLKSIEKTLISDLSNKIKNENETISEINNKSQDKKGEFSDIEILSDTSDSTDNKLILKGNVLIKRNGLIISADKLTFYEDTKTFLIEGNIFFRTKDHFIIASEIKYNLLERNGYIKDAYGSINLDTIGSIDSIKNRMFL